MLEKSRINFSGVSSNLRLRFHTFQHSLDQINGPITDHRNDVEKERRFLWDNNEYKKLSHEKA